MNEGKWKRGVYKEAKRIIQNIDVLKILSTQGVNIQRKRSLPEPAPDFTIKVRLVTGETYHLVFEIKSVGHPRYVRVAINELEEILLKKERSYGIVGAPYITERSADICRNHQVGFIDMSGNCFLNFSSIHVNIAGKPNLYPSTRALKDLFSSKSASALRVLLMSSKKEWTLKELSQIANISIGHAWNVKNKLLDNKFLAEHENGKFTVIKVPELLEEWGEHHAYRENKVSRFYLPDSEEEIAKKFVAYCNTNKIRYAFTGISAIALKTNGPWKKPVFAYVVGSPKNIAEDLEWEQVYADGNIYLLEPHSEAVFENSDDILGMKVVSDIQIYLDLQSFEGQAGKSARKFLKTILGKPDKSRNRRKK